MALKNIYAKNGYYAVAQTGNTLGMAGNTSQVTYHTSAYVTLNPAQNNGTGCPSNTGTLTYGGTSSDYRQNGAFAFLNPSTAVVPTGATVDYAVVTWVGIISSPTTVAIFNLATIPFTDPTGTVHILSPNLALNAEPTGNYNMISRSADVTTIVASAGYGKYTLERVPGPTAITSPESCGGWTLVVVYKHSSLPYRNVTINVGTVGNNIPQTVGNFYAPTSGQRLVRVFGTWTQGNSDYANESFLFNSVSLSGPNNPANNFFCSQINDDLGFAQNTSGSFANQSCTPGQRPIGQRTNYDITNVPANNVLSPGQRSATMMAFSSGIEITNTHILGTQIDNNAPILTATKSVDLSDANLGDTITYTIVYMNTGSATASNMFFLDTIPPYTTFNSGSLLIDNVPNSGNPESGVILPNLLSNSVTTVQFSVKVINSLKGSVSIPNVSHLNYDFISDPLLPAILGSISSNTVNTNVIAPPLSIEKMVDKNYVTLGNTISYTAVISNNSLNTINDILFLDTIPSGTSFIPSSVYIDGSQQPSDNPSLGITIPSISPDVTITITFSVLVTG